MLKFMKYLENKCVWMLQFLGDAAVGVWYWSHVIWKICVVTSAVYYPSMVQTPWSSTSPLELLSLFSPPNYSPFNSEGHPVI